MSIPAFFPYTGEPVATGLEVRLGQVLLHEGLDYSLAYQSRLEYEPGTEPPSDMEAYRLIVTGKGAYTGSQEVWFDIIEPNDLRLADARLARNHFAYTGQAPNLSLSVSMNGAPLTEGTDFTVHYLAPLGRPHDGPPVEKGHYYQMVITGQGAYTGRTSLFIFISTFSDVAPAHWGYQHIENLYNSEIISGYKGTHEFKPGAEVSRQEAAKMTALGAGRTASPGFVSSLLDISPGDWAYPYITALEEAGAISGFKGSREFRPRESIKRSHAAKMVVLAFGLEMGQVDYDLSDIRGADCEAEIRILASNGIVGGYKGTSLFRPSAMISRAEFAKIIDLAIQALEP